MNTVYLVLALFIACLVPMAASALTVREPGVAQADLIEPLNGESVSSAVQRHRVDETQGLLAADITLTIPLAALPAQNPRLTAEDTPISQLSPVCDIPDGLVCRDLGGPWEGAGPVADEATTAPTPVPSDTFTFQLGLFIIGALLLTIRRSPEYRAWYDSIFGPLVDY
jgi:hypothetical protein